MYETNMTTEKCISKNLPIVWNIFKTYIFLII